MSTQYSTQDITHTTYEDPEIVKGYIARNALQPKQAALVKEFSKSIKGRKVLDLGCGPGHDSYLFTELGFTVTGLDYSSEMINSAREFKQSETPPTFLVGDIRKLTEIFAENEFDAVWASASLLHIRPDDITTVLAGINTVAKSGAVIYIGLKAGQGTHVVTEDKLGKPMQREFTLWSKQQFLQVVESFGWHLDDFQENFGSPFMGKQTQWLRFFFTIV